VFAIPVNPNRATFNWTVHHQSQLGVLYRRATLKAGEWIIHHAKVHIAIASGRDGLEQLSVKRYRLEKHHPKVACPRYHAILTVVKQRHAKPTAALECKPIAVSAPHCVNFSHETSLLILPSPEPWPGEVM
jgi:hypothetical protein